MSQLPQIHVLFVCLGNICRSPTADAVMRYQVAKAGLQGQIRVDSAGTGDWHIGHAPDKRATAHAKTRGYDLSPLRARQVSHRDFAQFDYVLAMDNQNLMDLQAMKPESYAGHLGLFLDILNHDQGMEVPDPYYGGEEGFEQVLNLVEDACSALLDTIRSSKLS